MSQNGGNGRQEVLTGHLHVQTLDGHTTDTACTDTGWTDTGCTDTGYK